MKDSTSTPGNLSWSGIRSPRRFSRKSAARSPSRTSWKATTAEKRTPTITVKTKKAGDERKYLLPTGAHLMVQNGAEVYPGDIVAKIPRATTKTKDITGGLPRVVELFEARHPRDKAVISEVDGTVHHGPLVKGMRRVIVETEEG